jgi:RNA polymerase sigma-70 factor (ECF subfamily)
MGDRDRLAARVEEHRAQLRAFAHPMLGSLSEADDKCRRPGCGNAGPARAASRTTGWLTTVAARVCRNTPRSRKRWFARVPVRCCAGPSAASATVPSRVQSPLRCQRRLSRSLKGLGVA